MASATPPATRVVEMPSAFLTSLGAPDSSANMNSASAVSASPNAAVADVVGVPSSMAPPRARRSAGTVGRRRYVGLRRRDELPGLSGHRPRTPGRTDAPDHARS